jgi:hypothetical protein
LGEAPVVRGITDAGGAVLRTLHRLQPASARFGWSHAALLSERFTSELALAHHNYWAIAAGAEAVRHGVRMAGRLYATYPTVLAACERYLLRLEALHPAAFRAETIEAFASGLAGWSDLPGFDKKLVALHRGEWPPP